MGTVQIGRPPTLPTAVVRRIQRERAKGRTLAAIAEGLNQDGVPTDWYATSGTKKRYELGSARSESRVATGVECVRR